MLTTATVAYRPNVLTKLRSRFSRRNVRRWMAHRALWFIAWQDDSDYRAHALRELAAIGYDPKEKTGPNRWIQDNLLELLAVLSLQGHSGGSIGYCISAFSDLGRFQPLGPLTGADDEWNEISEMNGGEALWQNNRCSHVFKGSDGRAYDINGRIFREPNGCCYTNKDSRVCVSFPYVPKREYVDVDE